jgi:hypothetical protein
MATKISNFSVTSTGSKSITGVPFPVAEIEFWLAQKPGTTENFAHISNGFADGTTQMAHCVFQDTTGGKTQSYTDRCVNHKSRIGGVIGDAISATYTSSDDNGGGDYGFTINVTALNDGTQKIYYKARG